VNLRFYASAIFCFCTSKQILAQQPFLVKASPFGISRHIGFFYEAGLSDQCPQPLLHEGKIMTNLGFEPATFGYQVGNATNWTTEVVIAIALKDLKFGTQVWWFLKIKPEDTYRTFTTRNSPTFTNFEFVVVFLFCDPNFSVS
jgi:hypothetical protein